MGLDMNPKIEELKIELKLLQDLIDSDYWQGMPQMSLLKFHLQVCDLSLKITQEMINGGQNG